MSWRDPAASIRQRLLDRARTDGRPFQELLQYYAMERFLYRLAQSPHRDRFVLKGALLMTAWRSPESRPTKDVDLEGPTSNDPDPGDLTRRFSIYQLRSFRPIRKNPSLPRSWKPSPFWECSTAA